MTVSNVINGRSQRVSESTKRRVLAVIARRSGPPASAPRRLGRSQDSRAAYDRAIELAGNTAETAT